MPSTRSEIFTMLENFCDSDWNVRKKISRELIGQAGASDDAARETVFAISDKIELCRESRGEAEFKNILYWSIKTLGGISNSSEACSMLVNVVKDRFIKDKYREIAMTELLNFQFAIDFRNELIGLLSDNNWKIRQLAARHLETFPPDDVSDYIMKEFHDLTNDDIIYWALQIIAHQLGEKALAFFEGVLYSSPTNTKLYVILALSEIGTDPSFKLIVDCFDDPSYMIRTQVHQIVEKNIKLCARYVYNFAFSTDFRTRCEALKFLVKSMEPQYQDMITKMVSQGSTENRILGLISLGDAGEITAIEFIYSRFSDESWYVRNFAASVMSRYGASVWGFLNEKYRTEKDSNNRYWILICKRNIIEAGSEKQIDDLFVNFRESKKSEKLQILGIISRFFGRIESGELKKKTIFFLIDSLKDPKWLVRREASTMLTKLPRELVKASIESYPQLCEDQKFWLKEFFNE